ncbi:MAG: hypothetical protein ACE361_01165 [Aureliella sp.]
MNQEEDAPDVNAGKKHRDGYSQRWMEELLKEWGEWKTPDRFVDSEQIKDAAKQLILANELPSEPSELESEVGKSVEVTRRGASQTDSRRYDLVAFLGTVAGLLIALGFYWLGSRMSTPGSNGELRNAASSKAELVHSAFELTVDDIQQARVVAVNYQRLFGGRFAAALETEESVDLIVSQQSETSQAAAEAALLRLSYASKNADGSWNPVWNCDVLTRADRAFVLQGSKSEGDLELEIWTHELPDGNVLVDFGFGSAALSRPNRQVVLELARANLQAEQLFCTAQNGVEYCLFQSGCVVALDSASSGESSFEVDGIEEGQSS